MSPFISGWWFHIAVVANPGPQAVLNGDRSPFVARVHYFFLTKTASYHVTTLVEGTDIRSVLRNYAKQNSAPKTVGTFPLPLAYFDVTARDCPTMLSASLLRSFCSDWKQYTVVGVCCIGSEDQRSSSHMKGIWFWLPVCLMVRSMR